ncbi:hypothetical protein [Streptomyces sp. NPDC059828]|uniref:hypothetical protein n=1 Tax=Streptomyces sp. NPDC059828 TaxID=3346965 RepID=UPI0036537C92
MCYPNGLLGVLGECRTLEQRRQLTGEERVDLAGCLPLEAARVLTAQIPDTQPLTGWAFVKDLAARTGATLITRILHQLLTGYALLFGRAELTLAA